MSEHAPGCDCHYCDLDLPSPPAPVDSVASIARVGREHLQAGNIDDALTAFNRIAALTDTGEEPSEAMIKAGARALAETFRADDGTAVRAIYLAMRAAREGASNG